MFESLVYVYCLTHPETGEVRYVGRTKSPAARLSQHVSQQTIGHVPPKMVVLCACSDEAVAAELEGYFIQKHGGIGRLANRQTAMRQRAQKRCRTCRSATHFGSNCPALKGAA